MKGNIKLKEEYLPPQNPEALVLGWIKRARESQFSHYECQKRYEKNHLWIGIPSIALTAITGASVFVSFQQSTEVWIKYCAVTLALIATALTALQTFLNNGEKAKLHKEAGNRYGIVRRKLEILYATKSYTTQDIQKLEEELSNAATSSPVISSADFNKTKRVLYSMEQAS